MARYKLQKDEDGNTVGVIINDGTHPELPQGACIPNAADNRHWVEYVAWEAEPGNDADAADLIDWMARMRAERDGRLQACDWTQLADVPLPDWLLQEWQTYRQALRDMPQNNPDVDTKGEYEALVWPTQPSGSSSSLSA